MVVVLAGPFQCGSDVWLQQVGINTAAPRDKAALDRVRTGSMDQAAADSHSTLPALSRSDIAQGLILICKVFLGNCLASADAGGGADTGRPGGVASPADDSDNESVPDAPKKAPKPSLFHSAVISRGDDAKQRQWVVLDPAVILPEYAVEVEYDWDTPEDASSRMRDKDASVSMSSELAALAAIGSGALLLLQLCNGLLYAAAQPRAHAQV